MQRQDPRQEPKWQSTYSYTFQSDINIWSKYKFIAAHGILLASAPHAPAPPADCIDLSTFAFVKLHTIQGQRLLRTESREMGEFGRVI